MRSFLYFILLLFIAILIFTALLDSIARPDENIKHYDRQHNVTGYTVIENGKESHFDHGWNRAGRINERGILYDKDQNRTGGIKWEGNIGYIFDRAGNRTGYVKKQNGKETFYDRNWRREGYRK